MKAHKICTSCKMLSGNCPPLCTWFQCPLTTCQQHRICSLLVILENYDFRVNDIRLFGLFLFQMEQIPWIPTEGSCLDLLSTDVWGLPTCCGTVSNVFMSLHDKMWRNKMKAIVYAASQISSFDLSSPDLLPRFVFLYVLSTCHPQIVIELDLWH